MIQAYINNEIANLWKFMHYFRLIDCIILEILPIIKEVFSYCDFYGNFVNRYLIRTNFGGNLIWRI